MKLHKEAPIYSLEPGIVHVWLFRLDGPRSVDPAWKESLSNEEIGRSAQYKFEADRLRFVARRWILRQLLGRYSGVPPAEIVYHTDPHGKLSFPSHPISFNLSSSQDWMAFAFVLEREIGIDIEQVRPLPDLFRMAERWFSPEERAGLAALSSERRADAFYHIWTQKEAFIKAHGLGLSYPLEDFSVSVDPDEPARILSLGERVEDCTDWKILNGSFAPGWRVAVCVRTEAALEVCWIMPDLVDFASEITAPSLWK